MRTAESERGQRPSPDVEDGPDDPTDLSSRSWRYVARRTLREFSSDGCTDIAAALTYYGVLALFPGLIALISLVGLVGRGRESADTVLEVLRGVGAGSAHRRKRDHASRGHLRHPAAVDGGQRRTGAQPLRVERAPTRRTGWCR